MAAIAFTYISVQRCKRDALRLRIKSQIEPVKWCFTNLPQPQLMLQQCMPQKVQLSAADGATIKKRQMQYSIDGYHSLKSAE